MHALGPLTCRLMEVERAEVIHDSSLTDRDGTEKGDKGDFGEHFECVGEMNS